MLRHTHYGLATCALKNSTLLRRGFSLRLWSFANPGSHRVKWSRLEPPGTTAFTTKQPLRACVQWTMSPTRNLLCVQASCGDIVQTKVQNCEAELFSARRAAKTGRMSSSSSSSSLSFLDADKAPHLHWASQRFLDADQRLHCSGQQGLDFLFEMLLHGHKRSGSLILHQELTECF